MTCAQDFLRRGAHEEALAFVRRLAALGAAAEALDPIPDPKEDHHVHRSPSTHHR